MNVHARELFILLLGIALDSGARLVFERWMWWMERRSGRVKRNKVRQDDYYTPCGPECTIK